MHNSTDTLKLVSQAGLTKAKAPLRKLLLLGFLAGLMIAFAALASTITSMNLLNDPATFGLGKLVCATVFTSGLIMVVITGSELFTGNMLMLTSLYNRKISLKQLLRNWGLVYLGNLCGSLFLVLLVAASGIFNYDQGLLGTTTANIAHSKMALSFGSALILGTLCNILVCIAVWMAFAAQSVSGKILAIFFPILLFVASGFEHSIANMYYIPAGLFASADFNWWGFLGNLLPVTLGNIIGGGLFVATFFYLSLQTKTLQPHKKTLK